MKTLADIEHFEGVKALVRVDFNVPVKNGMITDDFRIRKALPTIDLLRSKGARVILMSHIETSDGLAKGEGSKVKGGDKPTLAPVAEYLTKKGLPLTFVQNTATAFQATEAMKDGEILLMENLRENPGETKNDRKFAQELASLGDIYVNDAFSVSHREHASVCAVTEFLPSYAGLQLELEVKNLSVAFNPTHPFIFILGGAKFSTKLPLIQRFAETADTIFIGGALANDALKAKGFDVGASMVSDGSTDVSAVVARPNVMIPVDATLQDRTVKDVGAVSGQDRILDVGPQTSALLNEKISAADFILWNGPLGLYEDGFTESTTGLARMIAERTVEGKATSIVGGGDTLAAIATTGVEDKMTFVSTGGGAMLDFLALGTLPGIKALEESEA